MTNNYMGRSGFIWFFGRVEDNNDPLMLGRVRVRVFGLHTEDTNLIPTKHLPWAIPIQPVTSAAFGGIGRSPTGMIPGTQVFGFFADGEDCQIPFILGTVASGLGHFALSAIDNVSQTLQTIQEATSPMTPIENSRTGTNFTSKAGIYGFKLMRDLGISDFQAAAILGNLAHESLGMICDIREIQRGQGVVRGKCWPKGTRRKGYGWAQWTNPDRMDKFIEFCQSRYNVNICETAATDDMNYAFLIHELKSGVLGNILTAGGRYTSKGVTYRWVGLKKTKTIEEATIDFMNSFEKPANESRKEAERKNLAYQALQAMNASSVPLNSTSKNQTVTR